LRNAANLGVAAAWNQILRFRPGKENANAFDYDYYVISNNDVLFGSDWLQPMVETMEADKTIGWLSAMEMGPLYRRNLPKHTTYRKSIALIHKLHTLLVRLMMV